MSDIIIEALGNLGTLGAALLLGIVTYGMFMFLTGFFRCPPRRH